MLHVNQHSNLAPAPVLRGHSSDDKLNSLPASATTSFVVFFLMFTGDITPSMFLVLSLLKSSQRWARRPRDALQIIHPTGAEAASGHP